MKFTLLTYDCMLAHNAGYAHSANAVEFIQRLQNIITEFSASSGVKSKDIYWEYVSDSDWCKNCLILWAKVSPEWNPTPETDCWDVEYYKDWHPDLARSLGGWIRGRGERININNQPPKNPHKLFKSILKSL